MAVIVSEMEHHSNLLPWREAVGAEAVFLAESDEAGSVDVAKLNKLLKELRKTKRFDLPLRRLKMFQ